MYHDNLLEKIQLNDRTQYCTISTLERQVIWDLDFKKGNQCNSNYLELFLNW